MSDKRIIFLDTETTGIRTIDGNRLVEIAALEMRNRRLTGAKFHEYLNSGREIESGALAVHGITKEFLQDKGQFKDIYQDFLAFIKDAEVVIHNAAFDVDFINYELSLLETASPQAIRDFCTVTCSLEMARKRFPTGKNSLDALCQRFGINNSQRALHGALIDCDLLAQVYLSLTSGQTQLFSAQTTGSQNLERVGGNYSDIDLAVIKANDSDRAAHQAYLDRIQSKITPPWETV